MLAHFELSKVLRPRHEYNVDVSKVGAIYGFALYRAVHHSSVVYFKNASELRRKHAPYHEAVIAKTLAESYGIRIGRVSGRKESGHRRTLNRLLLGPGDE
jgi:hypothetical protein